jgi:hypothetical protein
MCRSFSIGYVLFGLCMAVVDRIRITTAKVLVFGVDGGPQPDSQGCVLQRRR